MYCNLQTTRYHWFVLHFNLEVDNHFSHIAKMAHLKLWLQSQSQDFSKNPGLVWKRIGFASVELHGEVLGL